MDYRKQNRYWRVLPLGRLEWRDVEGTEQQLEAFYSGCRLCQAYVSPPLWTRRLLALSIRSTTTQPIIHWMSCKWAQAQWYSASSSLFFCDSLYLRACCEQVLFSAASVCLSTRDLENYLTETDVTWYEYIPQGTLEVVESWYHLTFDLGSYFRIFSFTMHVIFY